MEKKTILIIDDDQGIREAVQEFLEMEGFLVKTAVNGEDGLRVLRQMRPDLILLDLMMPTMNGFEFRERQLAEQIEVDVPLVLMSADSQIEKKQAQAGILDCLRKPMDVNELLDKLHKYCK